MKAINKQQAKTISELINSLTIWMLAVERNNSNHEQTVQYMIWHDQYADKLEEHGISVVRYNHPEKV